MSPSGKNRGGTPEVVRVPKGRVPQPARLRWLRNSILRRSASFISFFVAGWNEVKSGSGIEAFRSSPDYASLHPGYVSSDLIVMKPVTTTGFV
jgi:hypothetical protein